MFITEDIRRVSFIIFREDHTRVMTALGEAGLLHCARMGDDRADQGASDLYQSVRMIRMRLDAVVRDIFPLIIETASQAPAETELAQRDHGADERLLKKMELQHNRFRILDEIFTKEISSIEKRIEERSDLANLPVPEQAPFLKSVRGYISGESPAPADDYYIVRNNRAVVAMCLPQKWGDMMSALRAAGFEIADSRDIKEEYDKLVARCEYLKKRRIELGNIIHKKSREWEEMVRQLLSIYPAIEEMDLEAQKWVYLKNLVLMGGWIEKKQEPILLELLKNNTSKGFYCHMDGRLQSLRSNPPVRLKNTFLVKPFELLVKSMGMPANTEIDPSPLAGIIYIFLFGMMFGDLGQGLVLILAGFLLYLHYRADISDKKFFGSMLMYCGVSSMIWGAMYGGFFSNEHLLKPLLFHPTERVMDLFLLAVVTGACCITVALALNVINTFLAQGIIKVLINPSVFPALLLYTGAIYLVWHYVQYKSLPGISPVWIMILLPLLVLVLRGPLAVLFIPGARAFPHGIAEYTMETLADVIEMGSSFLANTISFIRAGAFALSHAGLGFAFYSLASIIPGGMYGPGGLGIIVIGNVFIILLEGLVCGIQSMRLEYYELFSRFYRGDGVEFSPFRFTRITFKGGVT